MSVYGVETEEESSIHGIIYREIIVRGPKTVESLRGEDYQSWKTH